MENKHIIYLYTWLKTSNYLKKMWLPYLLIIAITYFTNIIFSNPELYNKLIWLLLFGEFIIMVVRFIWIVHAYKVRIHQFYRQNLYFLNRLLIVLFIVLKRKYNILFSAVIYCCVNFGILFLIMLPFMWIKSIIQYINILGYYFLPYDTSLSWLHNKPLDIHIPMQSLFALNMNFISTALIVIFYGNFYLIYLWCFIKGVYDAKH